MIQTWCHCRPVETPTIACTTAIRVEEDVHGVGHARYDWRQEVTGRSWTIVGVATALAQQGCPVPICDLDIVVGTTICKPNSSEGELYPQNFPTLYLNCLCPIEVVGILVRVVWRGDNTCGKQSFQLNSTKGIFFFDNFPCITHPRCHRCLQDKLGRSARVRLRWSSQGHKRG